MDASTKKTFIWLGGIILVSAAVGGVAYAATHAATAPPQVKPAPPAPGPGQPQLVGSWQQGSVYLLTSQVPTGVNNTDQLIQALQANGWTNVTITYFGPTGSVVAGAPNPFTTTPTSYVAKGTWSGASAMAVPQNVQSVLSS